MKDSLRRSWVNITLVVLASIAAVLVVLTRTVWTSAEREARASHLVVGFRASDVTRVEVSYASERVVIERDTASERAQDENNDDPAPPQTVRFRVLEPFQGEAEEAAVDGLLRAIEFATVARKVDEATFDRRAAGLDEPEQVMQLHMGQVELRLRIGREAPAPRGARYVEVAGVGVANRGVYVVSESTAKDLMVTPDAFRVKQLVPYAGSALRKIVLRSSSERELVLLRDEKRGAWKMNRGALQVRVSRTALERLFAAFARSELERVLGPEVPNHDVGTQVAVELTPKDASKAPFQLRFGGKCPDAPELELATRIEPERVNGCTRPLHLETFLAEPDTLVDEGLLALRADEVEELTITRGDKVLELARRDAAWHMRQPQQGTVERDVGQSFVQLLTALRGELSDPPEKATVDVVVVARSGGDLPSAVREERFEVTHSTPQGVFVHRLDDDVWLKIAPHVTEQLAPFELLLRQSALTSFEADELKTVTTTTRDWEQRFLVTEQGKGCKLEKPTGFEAEPSACLDVIDALRSLRAQSWVASAREPLFGLEEPVATVQWVLQDGALRQLTIGAAAKGATHYAALDQGPVFTVSKTTVEALTTLVVARYAFVIDPELLQSVVLVTRSRRVELMRLGDEFISKGDGSANANPIEPGQIQALIDALGLLKAEAAVLLLPSDSAHEPGTRSSRAPSRAEFGLVDPLLEVSAVQRSGAGLRTTHFKVGVGDVYRDTSVYYAEPVTREPHALFVLPRAAVTRILDALQ